MPDIQIIKLKIRRGSDAQRKTVLLEQGELGYTIDTKRLFVGDGTTIGGTPAGTVSHLPRITPGGRTSIVAERGDIVYDTSMLFQLTGTNSTQLSAWARIGTVTDNSTIEYSGSNVLQIKNNGITGNKFNSNAVAPTGGLRVNPTLGLSANVDTRFIVISGNNVITLSAFNSNQVISSSLGNGLIGGNGTQMSVAVDQNIFGFTTGALTLTSLPANVVTVDSLSSNFLGQGLEIDPGDSDKIRVNTSQLVDNTTLEDSGGNTLKLKGINTSGGAFGGFIEGTYNIYGQVLSSGYTIINTFTGVNNTTNAILSVFNGFPSQTTQGANLSAATRPVIFSAVSGSPSGATTNISLSSAGYIAFEGTPAQNGYADRFAIPIFTW
jgi:hypothetical protein